MAAMEMVSTGWVMGVSFQFEKCTQGVASVLFKKIPTFGSRRPNLDHLTVLLLAHGNRTMSSYAFNLDGPYNS